MCMKMKEKMMGLWFILGLILLGQFRIHLIFDASVVADTDA